MENMWNAFQSRQAQVKIEAPTNCAAHVPSCLLAALTVAQDRRGVCFHYLADQAQIVHNMQLAHAVYLHFYICGMGIDPKPVNLLLHILKTQR